MAVKGTQSLGIIESFLDLSQIFLRLVVECFNFIDLRLLIMIEKNSTIVVSVDYQFYYKTLLTSMDAEQG